jgi:hypothetical protein
MNPIKNRGLTQVLWKGKQFLFYRPHGACISSATHLVNPIAFNNLQLAQLEKLSFFRNLLTLLKKMKKSFKNKIVIYV